jgi:hypothetical protein
METADDESEGSFYDTPDLERQIERFAGPGTPEIFEETQIKRVRPVVAERALNCDPHERELEEALAKMIRKRILPDAALRVEVCNYGRKKSAQLILAEEYDEAAAIELAVDIIFVNIREDEVARDAQTQVQVLEQRLEEAKQQGEVLEQELDGVIEMRRARTRCKIRQLEKEHKRERAAFAQFWARDEARVPFSKPSAELLQIRQRQKAYALVHDFANAKAMKLAAKALEKQETAEGTKRFANALRTAYEQLLDRQQREMQCMAAKSETDVAALTTEKEKVLSSNELTKKALELRIINPKHQKKPTIQCPVVKPRATVVNGAAPGMVNQRTRSQLASYRKAPDLGRLPLETPDPAAILLTSARRILIAPRG